MIFVPMFAEKTAIEFSYMSKYCNSIKIYIIYFDVLTTPKTYTAN